jgi:Tol biopolymer transport system component
MFSAFRRSWLLASLFLLLSGLGACGDGTGPHRNTILSNQILVATIEPTSNASGILVMNPDGSGQVSLTADDRIHSGPEASPDGRKVVFTKRLEFGTSFVYIMNADGSDLVQLTASGFDEEATWSPDGTRILFEGSGGLSLISPDGTGLTQLTNAAENPADSPAWSPDGSLIAVSEYDPVVGDREIHVMNADGSNDVRLTTLPGEDLAPAWSPDGTRLAFSHQSDTESLQRWIYVMNADGSAVTPVTSGDVADHSPSWAPDGKTIVFGRLTWTAPGPQKQQIHVVDLASGTVSQLSPVGASTPSWVGVH